MVTRHVVVMPYDERWTQDFEAIASEIRNVLGELALAIEHVGSTAVLGLSAKPIIDIDVVIRDYAALDAVVCALRKYRTNGRHVWRCHFCHAHPANSLTCRQQACEICRRA